MTDMCETAADVRRHELLADIAENVARQLIEKHGIAQETAVDVGNGLADFLSEHWKGQTIYMVGDQSFKLTKRDLEIFHRMERGNAQELAAEFGISYVRVYQIYRRVLMVQRRRLQPDLFSDTPARETEAAGGELSTDPGAALARPNSGAPSLEGNSDIDVRIRKGRRGATA